MNVDNKRKNIYLIGGCCFILIIFLGVIFMFSKSYALEGFGRYNLNCDKSIAKGGDVITCNVTGTVVAGSQVSAVETKVELSDNLEFVSFTTDEIWQGDGTNGFIALYTDENKTDTFNIGTLVVKVNEDITNTIESISFKEGYFYDANFEEQSIENTLVEIKTPQYSSKVYDLSKDYIISNSKDIATIINNISTEGCSTSIYRDDKTINSGTIVDGDKLVVKNGDNILKEFSIVYIDSNVYDLSKNYVISSVDTLTDIIKDISVINGSLSIKNNQLVLSYNNTGIVTYDILNINSNLYKIDLNNNYIFINGEINDGVINNIIKTDNINLNISEDNLNISYNDKIIKSLKILNIYSTKYDIDIENGFIYVKGDTSFSNITSNNVSITPNNDKLVIKYNDISVIELNILHISSSNYKINYDDKYIYTYADKAEDLIKNNITIFNGNIYISNNKLQLKYNDLLIDEFTLYYLNSSQYNIDSDNIYIKGSVEYNTFINNIEFNGLSYKVYNTSNELVTSGNIDDNFNIKILIGDLELSTYNIKTEYLEISDELSIKDDENIIYSIMPGTTFNDIIEKIDTSGEIEIYNSTGKKMNVSNVVSTLSSLKIKLSTKTYEYKLSVLGDTTCNGEISLGDVAKLYSYSVGRGDIEFSTSEIFAGDLTKNNEVSFADVAKLYSFYVGRGEL